MKTTVQGKLDKKFLSEKGKISNKLWQMALDGRHGGNPLSHMACLALLESSRVTGKKKSSVKGEGNNFTQEGRTPVILSTINNCMLI